MKGPIRSIEVTYLVHATEDPEKVQSALTWLLGTTTPPALERLEGHFGNDILRARLHLTGDEAQSAFECLLSQMPQGVMHDVLSEIASHVDEHSALFLRFDKQGLVAGSLRLGSADAVRVKVKPRGFIPKGGADAFYAGLLRGA